MQGKKQYHEKLFLSFRLSERVPETNFYRRLRETLDLKFLYKHTEDYYGKEGQKSIDPIVFFKVCFEPLFERGIQIYSPSPSVEYGHRLLEIGESRPEFIGEVFYFIHARHDVYQRSRFGI